MSRRFFFEPEQYRAPTIAELRRSWRHIPSAEARNAIAVENQYLEFHRHLIASIRHQSPAGNQPMELGLSLRAGALKAGLLICASIAEAALLAHAEARGYTLPAKRSLRTFGRILKAWQNRDAKPQRDVAAIWDELQRLHSGRNRVHLYRAVESGRDFYDVLEAEAAALNEGERVLAHLRTLRTEWRVTDSQPARRRRTGRKRRTNAAQTTS